MRFQLSFWKRKVHRNSSENVTKHNKRCVLWTALFKWRSLRADTVLWRPSRNVRNSRTIINSRLNLPFQVRAKLPFWAKSQNLFHTRVLCTKTKHYICNIFIYLLLCKEILRWSYAYHPKVQSIIVLIQMLVAWLHCAVFQECLYLVHRSLKVHHIETTAIIM